MANKNKIIMPGDSQKEANEILQKLNVIKMKFNSAKGQADGMINDGFSSSIQESANLIAMILREKTALQMRNTALEIELNKFQKPQKKLPPNMESMADVEKSEPEPEPK